MKIIAIVLDDEVKRKMFEFLVHHDRYVEELLLGSPRFAKEIITQYFRELEKVIIYFLYLEEYYASFLGVSEEQIALSTQKIITRIMEEAL